MSGSGQSLGCWWCWVTHTIHEKENKKNFIVIPFHYIMACASELRESRIWRRQKKESTNSSDEKYKKNWRKFLSLVDTRWLLCSQVCGKMTHSRAEKYPRNEELLHEKGTGKKREWNFHSHPSCDTIQYWRCWSDKLSDERWRIRSSSAENFPSLCLNSIKYFPRAYKQTENLPHICTNWSREMC